MTEKQEPQSFAHLLAEADSGLINRRLSEEFGGLMQYLQDRASLHEDTFKGTLTIKIDVKVDERGKVECAFTPTIKKPTQKMPVARFYVNEDQKLQVNDPKQPGLFEAVDGGERRIRDAGAPRAAK